MSRSVGDVNEITRITRQVFSDAFIRLGGVDALIKWARGLEGTSTTPANGDNMKHFYTLFAKVLPKEIKTEDMNRTHEQFIEALSQQNKHLELTKGEPVGLIETTAGMTEKKPNTT